MSSPPWKETRALILSQGVPEARLEAALALYREKYGGFIKSDDLLYRWVAQNEFSIVVAEPESAPTERSAPGDRVLVASDVTVKLAEESKNQYFAIRGWLADPQPGTTTKGSKQLAIDLLDDSGWVRLRVYGDDNVERWEETKLTYPVFVQLDGVQLLATKGGPVVTVGRGTRLDTPSEAPYTFDEILPDAGEKSIQDWQLAKFKGLVDSEERNTYIGCLRCTASMKGGRVCPRCNYADGSKTFEIHRLRVTDGASTHKLSLPPELAPGKNLYGHPVETIARYNARYREYRAFMFKVNGEAQFRPPSEVFVKPKTGIRPSTSDVLNRFVRVYRTNPLPIVRKALIDGGLTEADANAELQRAQAQNLIVIEGDLVRWVGETAEAPQQTNGAAPKVQDQRVVARRVLTFIQKGCTGGNLVNYTTVVEFLGDEKKADEIVAYLQTEKLVEEPMLGKLRAV